MRLELMATYQGVPYQAGLGPDGTEVTLFSPGPPPEELGFAATGGHWRKQVSVTDLDDLWQSRPVGEYRGEPCLVLDDLGGRLHIAYLGRDAARAGQLGYWEIDREVFEVVVARRDITNLTEERVDFPLAAAIFPSADAGPQARASAQATAATEPAGPERFTGAPAGQAIAGQTVAESAGPAGYGAAIGYGEAIGYGATVGGGTATGYGGSDHTARVPDRVAAWHGSPAPEPWPEPSGVAGPWREPSGVAGPWPDPRAGRWPAPRAWSDPSGPEPWMGRQPGSDQLERGTGSDQPAEHGTGSDQPAEHGTGSDGLTEHELWPDPVTVRPGRRTGHRDRVSPDSVFAELLTLSAIPRASYAVDEEVPGALCLVKTDGGFEVFSRTDDARLDVRSFEDEEAAYFYLFGVLAAEAIRSGRLGPTGPGGANGRNNGSSASGASSASRGNVSKYLQGRKLPKSPCCPARVKLAGGADGPPLPKQPRRPSQDVKFSKASCVSRNGNFVITGQTYHCWPNVS
jgi:hypothetical protein